MRKLVFALLLFSSLFVAPLAVRAADSCNVCPIQRFEITTLPVKGTDGKVFRFDRVCGAIEMLGTDSAGKSEWQGQELPGLPGCVSDGHIHYHLYTPRDHVFIINIDVKATWELDPEKMTWRQM